jgi:hypothetical protein
MVAKEFIIENSQFIIAEDLWRTIIIRIFLLVNTKWWQGISEQVKTNLYQLDDLFPINAAEQAELKNKMLLLPSKEHRFKQKWTNFLHSSDIRTWPPYAARTPNQRWWWGVFCGVTASDTDWTIRDYRESRISCCGNTGRAFSWTDASGTDTTRTRANRDWRARIAARFRRATRTFGLRR